jgi:hypothetical protein
MISQFFLRKAFFKIQLISLDFAVYNAHAQPPQLPVNPPATAPYPSLQAPMDSMRKASDSLPNAPPQNQQDSEYTNQRLLLTFYFSGVKTITSEPILILNPEFKNNICTLGDRNLYKVCPPLKSTYINADFSCYIYYGTCWGFSATFSANIFIEFGF